MVTAINITETNVLEMIDECQGLMNIKVSARQLAISVLREALPTKIAELQRRNQEVNLTAVE